MGVGGLTYAQVRPVRAGYPPWLPPCAALPPPSRFRSGCSAALRFPAWPPAPPPDPTRVPHPHSPAHPRCDNTPCEPRA